jgi:hypothetical protein
MYYRGIRTLHMSIVIYFLSIASSLPSDLVYSSKREFLYPRRLLLSSGCARLGGS